MIEEINKAIKKYLKARKELLVLAKQEGYNTYLSGNDNIIGSRIGEYIAMRYYESIGKKVKKVKNITQRGHDLLIGRKRIQVKIISVENKRGTTVPLKEPWDEFMLIILNEKYNVDKIGLLTHKQFEKALEENKRYSSNPMVNRTMVGKRGIITKYGNIVETFNYL